MKASAGFPSKALPLFKPAPYKVLYGGRGGAKSWAAARALIILATRKTLFILCAREIQKSISESVHKLLVDQINNLGLDHAFDIQQRTIICTETGSRFVFAGVRNNITAIKSMESIDIAVVEEAEKVSGHSWSVLLPTIRRDPPHGPFGQGSEVWVVFNPELDSDFTYKYWVLDPPPGTVKMEMNWYDNPWFPEVLRKQKNLLKERDYESYLTVWEGKVRRIVQGAIYAKQLEAAQRDNRISPNILVDRSKPVSLGVDLGRGDMTAIWFFQQSGNSHYAIDYYENFGFDWEHYLTEIQNRRYVIDRIYLPHDARNELLAAKKSIYRQTLDVYPGDGRVVVVPRTTSIVNDVNAVRAMFSRLCFNETTCSAGLHSIAHYHYEVDPETREVKDKPAHDWASHGADALRYYVMGLRDHAVRRGQKYMPPALPQSEHSQGWMGL